MKSNYYKKPLSFEVQPVKPAGSINLGGEKIQISASSISSKPGISGNAVIKKLKEASKKSLFSTPASTANG